MREAWFNWAKGEQRNLPEPPQTDDEARQYVPQQKQALERYEHYRAIGLTPAAAVAQVVADLASGDFVNG